MNYLMRSKNGIMINLEKEKTIELQKGLIEFLNECAIINLSSYEGRIKGVKNIFGYSSKTPLYIDKENLFFPTKGVRNYDCVFINYTRLLSTVKWHNCNTKVVFKDLTELIIELDFNKIKKQITKCENIARYVSLKRKCLH